MAWRERGFLMFGRKEQIPTRVGALEKRRTARNIMGGGAPNRGKGDKQTSPAVIVISIFIVSTIVAYLLTINYIDSGGLHMSLGNDDLDRLLFKQGSHNFTGNQMMDYAILIGLRGFALFVATGIWPLVTLLLQRATDNAQVNLYHLFWATPVIILFVVLIFKDIFGPAVVAILGDLT